MTIKLPASITVDFSNSDDDGLVFARAVRATRVLDIGETVLATDGEEHVCDARVARIEGELVYLQLVWDSWTTIEFTQSTAGVAVEELVPTFVSNGGAAVESESAPVDVVT
jgi:hypothetical protein